MQRQAAAVTPGSFMKLKKEGRLIGQKTPPVAWVSHVRPPCLGEQSVQQADDQKYVATSEAKLGLLAFGCAPSLPTPIMACQQLQK